MSAYRYRNPSELRAIVAELVSKSIEEIAEDIHDLQSDNAEKEDTINDLRRELEAAL